MSRAGFTRRALTATAFMLAFAPLARAQASRTWVSGVGDDANPCSRTAPCKTFAGAISKTAAAGEISWTTDIKGAMARGVAETRPIYADFWAVWCVPCKAMEETTYRDAKVVAAMEPFVPLKVDQDVQPVFCERHQIEALDRVAGLDEIGRHRVAHVAEADECDGGHQVRSF